MVQVCRRRFGGRSSRRLPFITPVATAASRPQSRVVSFERGRRDLPKVALTFDGGGDAGESGQILDVLEQRGVTATFFLTGSYIRNNPDLVRRIAAAGHEVGNHTWSHPHLTTWNSTRRHDTLPGLGRAVIQEELSRAAQAYEAVTGRTMTAIWRAPFGEVNEDLLAWAATAGWSHVGWSRDDGGGRHSLDSLDWVAERSSRNYLTSEQITTRILSFGAGGEGLNGGDRPDAPEHQPGRPGGHPPRRSRRCPARRRLPPGHGHGTPAGRSHPGSPAAAHGRPRAAEGVTPVTAG